LNFDNTHIILGGFRIYEPVTILTNLVFCALCVVYFRQLSRFSHAYGFQMAWFILLMGTSSLLGAVAHAVHYQLGNVFFETVFFLMNALSLFSIYFCFRAPYTYYHLDKNPPRKYINLAILWVLVLLVYSFINGNFLLIKIHAGITLTYSFVVHYMGYRRKQERGSAWIVSGIGVAFLSIISHSMRFSIHEWFNYKDISHVIMIFSLGIIYKGIRLNLESLLPEEVSEATVASS
jgi:hypothetical protein